MPNKFYFVVFRESTQATLKMLVDMDILEVKSARNNKIKRGIFMTLIYALLGLVIGISIGAVAMRFGSRTLRFQNTLQSELEKSKADLATYREELADHFSDSAELLDNIAKDYRKLYQHMAKSYSNLLPDSTAQKHLFRYSLTEPEEDNYQAIVDMPPRDYSDCASGLLRKAHLLRK